MVFPLIIKQRQNIAKQNNIAPELQRCQADLQAAIKKKADQVEGIVLPSSYTSISNLMVSHDQTMSIGWAYQDDSSDTPTTQPYKLESF